MPPFCWTFVFMIVFTDTCHGFHFPGRYTNGHRYSVGETISVEVNSLISVQTQLPLSYYSLPYCVPQGGVKKSEMNLGQLLMGDQIESSSYRFQMDVNETVFMCIKGPLTADEAELLKQRTQDLYRVNMILDSFPLLDNLPAISFGPIGFPIGYTELNGIDDYYYINNHLNFRVLIGTGMEIVGFEVYPCSVKHSPDVMSKLHMYENVEPINCPWGLEKPQLIQENETLAFTYGVEFLKSDVKWAERWDGYLGYGFDEFRWLSIINSVETLLILAGIVFVIYWRTVRRERIRNMEFDNELQAQMNKELLGWKLVVGDVFREPNRAKLLCVLVGEGVQITGMALTMNVVAAFGFISPSSRGMLLTSLIMLYLPFGIVAGYAAVCLWRAIKGTSEGWKSVSCSVASFFLGIISVVLMILNFLHWQTGSTMAIPVVSFLILISLSFCISVPLTLIGGFLGTKADPIRYPVETSQVPREVPARRCWSQLLVLGAAFYPFAVLFIELRFILSCIWFGRFYSEYGFSLIVLLLILIACAVVSVILTYTSLRAEDWRWWWKAFFTSGSTGISMFLYSIYYLVSDLEGLSGGVSITLYMGYSLIMAIAVMLATGTIGFLVSFYFVHCLYSSFKIS